MYADEADVEVFLDTLNVVCYQHNCVIHAYCLMNNYYHLLLETLGKVRISTLCAKTKKFSHLISII
ncbi:transposase [Aeromonas caviae]|uniref:transposase n=1 Tax=Aeromonas caviae TaxID=648 RepID=UPI0038CF672D